MVLFDGNKTKLLWALCCLLLAKIRCSQLYSTKNMFCFVCRQIGHFPAICSGKWISFPIFNEWRWFLLDGTQKNVLACFWLGYAVLSIIFLRTTFTTFSYMKYVFDALTYRKHLLVYLQRIWAGLSFVSQKRAFFLFCV